MSSVSSPGTSHDAFNRLLQETHASVRAYLGGLGVPTADVDDVAQELYLDYWRRPDHPPEVPVRVWLLGMARNCAREFFRRRTRQGELLNRLVAELDRGYLEIPSDNGVTDEDLLLTHLRACVEALEESQRKLVDGIYRDGRSVREIAADLRRTPDAVHMLLVRLRTALRRCMDRRGSQNG